MSAALASRAEVVKLEPLLHAGDGALGFLEHVDADSLRLLREQATDMLFDADAERLTGVAAAAGDRLAFGRRANELGVAGRLGL